MAKLSKDSIKKLDKFARSFRNFTKIKHFKYEDIENRAEELEVDSPGNGYQLAYQENLTNMFEKLLENYMQGMENLPTLDEFVKYYDTFVIKTYLDEREKEGIGVNITMNGNMFTLGTLESFKKVLDKYPATTVVNEVNKKFASGELTLENTNAFAKEKEKAKAVPTRKEAQELVAYAAHLEQINKKRPVWKMLFSLPTHFTERSAIKRMRALAAKCDNVAFLMQEASNENSALKKLKSDVTDGIIIAKDREKPLIQLEDVSVLEPEKDKNLIETDDLYFVVDENENVLNQSIDLSTDGDVIGDDADVAKDFIGDDTMDAIEKVEFSEDDIDIFPNSSEAKESAVNHPVKEKQISK